MAVVSKEDYVGPHPMALDVHSPKFRPKELILPKNTVPIMAFDPGVTTGWSLMVLPARLNGKDILSWNMDAILRNRIKWVHGEVSSTGCEDEAVYALMRLVNEYPSAAIVVEDFILRAQRKEKSRELLSPVRITAKLETYLWRTGRQMFKQQPAQAKTTMTNDRLSLLKVKTDDMPDHARDADRHALLFLRRCLGPQGVALKRAAWPHIYTQEN